MLLLLLSPKSLRRPPNVVKPFGTASGCKKSSREGARMLSLVVPVLDGSGPARVSDGPTAARVTGLAEAKAEGQCLA